MKKAVRFFAIAAIAFGMTMAVSCTKDPEEGGNNNNNGGTEEPVAANPIVGHTYQGTLIDDTYAGSGYTFQLDFTIVATSETRMDYTCIISYDEGELGTDQDQMTYTFENNAGTMTFDADGYATEYTYDPQAKTVTFDIAYNISSLSVGGTAVLTQVQ